MSADTNTANAETAKAPDLEKGTRVRVTFEGDYQATTALGRMIVTTGPTESATGVTPVAGVTVEVIGPVLPPEPRSGQMVRAPWSNLIYRRDGVFGWYKINGVSASRGTYYTWRELNNEYGVGNLHRLVTDAAVTSAHDLCKETLKVGNEIAGLGLGLHSNSHGTITVQGLDPWSPTTRLNRVEARNVAFAILKATGGI